jgi:hypothetical protein
MIWEVLGVRMSVVVTKRLSAGFFAGEMKERKICERTWGCLSEDVATWMTYLYVNAENNAEYFDIEY